MNALPLQPGALSRRLTAGMVLVALVTHLVVAVLIVLAFSYHSHTVSATDARGRLHELEAQVTIDALVLDGVVVGFTDRDGVYAQTAAPAVDPLFVASTFDPWAAGLAEGTTAVWLDVNGRILAARGDVSVVDALTRLTLSAPTKESGAAALEGVSSLVAIHPVRQALDAPSVGFVALCRPLAGTDIRQPDFSAEVLAPTVPTPLGERGWHAVAGLSDTFQASAIRVTNADYTVQATLLGIDGAPALTARATLKNPVLGDRSTLEFLLVGLVFLAAVLLVSQVQGRSVAAGVNRPLALSIQHLREQGELVLKGGIPEPGSPIEDDAPDELKLLGETVSDLMSQLRASQSALIEERERAVGRERAFASVVEESTSAKVLVHGDVIEIANPAATRFFGLRAGDRVQDIKYPADAGIRLLDERDAEVTPAELLARASGEAVVIRIIGPDGAERWMEFHIDHIGRPGVEDSPDLPEQHYVVSARDITENRRLEALRAEVLSLVSHDLRSPLTVVLGYLDILGRMTDDERGKAAIDNARRAAWRIEELLRDLASATRAVGVLSPGVMRPVDLAELAADVASALQVEAEQTILLEAAESVYVLGDRVRLEQAITNLVGNAAKHGPANGSIRVAVTSADGRGMVTVEDEGPGVPAEQRELIFERSARGSGSERTPGMGLGLYIVRVVAEAHGGVAYVDGTRDHTCFVLDLPLTAAEPG